jgi:hypothetical protein
MKIRLFTTFLPLVLAGCEPSHESGNALPSVDWLPSAATDVTFVRNSGLFWNQAYECKMSRSEFDMFAARNEWSLTLRKDFTTGLRSVLGLPPVRSFYGTPTDYYPEALVYEKFQSNNGGIQVIYDIERSVLFVSESSN